MKKTTWRTVSPIQAHVGRLHSSFLEEKTISKLSLKKGKQQYLSLALPTMVSNPSLFLIVDSGSRIFTCPDHRNLYAFVYLTMCPSNNFLFSRPITSRTLHHFLLLDLNSLYFSITDLSLICIFYILLFYYSSHVRINFCYLRYVIVP